MRIFSIDLGFSLGSNVTSVSFAAATLTTQPSFPVDMICPTQPKFDPMQGRIKSVLPCFALLTRPGSAINALTIDTMSAWPSVTIVFAWSNVIIRPTTIVGFVNCVVIGSFAGISWPSGSSIGERSLWNRQYEPM